MKFFYDSVQDLLGITLKPLPKGEATAARREITAGVFLLFDQRQQLCMIEITQASQHHPEIKNIIGDLLQEILKHGEQIPKDILLAIEGTIKLSDEGNSPSTLPEYQPRIIFDALANLIITEFRSLKEGESLLPKQEVIPHVLASFDKNGHLVHLEMREALQHLPFLHQFIEQGKELIQFQALFNQNL